MSSTELPGVELRRGMTRALACAMSGQGVEVAVRDADGAESLVRARWAIAADGARSQSRKALGIETEKHRRGCTVAGRGRDS